MNSKTFLNTSPEIFRDNLPAFQNSRKLNVTRYEFYNARLYGNRKLTITVCFETFFCCSFTPARTKM